MSRRSPRRSRRSRRGSRGRKTPRRSPQQQPQQINQVKQPTLGTILSSTQPKGTMCIGEFCLDKQTLNAINKTSKNKQSVDCIWGDWTNWSDCSLRCGGGEKYKKRIQTQERQNAGIPCEGAFVQKEACNIDPCAEHCEVSQWSGWSECSEKCGTGKQNRSRNITKKPAHGGKPCPVLNEEEECNKNPCPVDCETSQWTSWSNCTKPCGTGTKNRTRKVTKKSMYGGEECPILSETENCNVHECPVDCVVSDWSEWSNCDKNCGGGKQKRTRVVEKNALHGGKSCPLLEEVRECNTQPCPVDCKVGPWDEWNTCSEECGTGTMKRSRAIVKNSAHGGKPCGSLVETEECNKQPCPVDCKVSEWNVWTACDKECGTGKQSRSRTVTTPAAYGGEECPVLGEEEECNRNPCPVDCVVSDWTQWSQCDKNCGGGEQRRTRKVLTQSAYGGKQCPVLEETKTCNTHSCAEDCEVSDWTQWGACNKDCGTGKQTRTRTVSKPAKFGGKACPPLSQSQDCNTQPCPVDCEVTNWTNWDTCTKECGTGKHTRTRTIKTQPAHGGGQCPPLSETENCNTQPCPIDCKVTDWTTWSKCDKPCGGGKQSRSRKITEQAQHGGKACPTNLTETRDCNTQACPIDCEISPWSAWGDCTKQCGTGKQTRTRKVNKKSEHGGKECSSFLSESRECNTQECPINCVVSDWTQWSSCDKECGTGKQSRTRSVTTPAAHGGTACPTNLSETRNCNTKPCPVDCEVTSWTGWSVCDKPCDSGKQSRTRTIKTPSAHGGTACPTNLREEKTCNTQKCPPPKITKVWYAVGAEGHFFKLSKYVVINANDSDMTFEAYVYPSDKTKVVGSIFNGIGYWTQNQWHKEQAPGWFIQGGGGIRRQRSMGIIRPGYNFPPNRWYHFVHVNNGNNSKVYINGRLIGTGKSYKGTIASWFGPYIVDVIGIENKNMKSRQWNGKMACVRIWNTNKLDINELYKNRDRIMPKNTKGLQHQWTFNGNSNDSIGGVNAIYQKGSPNYVPY